VSVPTLDPAGPWRFDELADMPADGRRYEVVDGHLVVTPPPSQDHQLVASRLQQQLAAVCPPEWEVVQEYPLPLGSDGRVPDLAVIRRRALAGGTPPYPQGLQDFGLVVEISSPSTRKTDLFAKPGEYAEAGIPLFWRVDLQPELAVHPFRLRPDGYLPCADVGGVCPVPWGTVTLDLRRVSTGQ
jgi:Uma2 family endonuclease